MMEAAGNSEKCRAQNLVAGRHYGGAARFQTCINGLLTALVSALVRTIEIFLPIFQLAPRLDRPLYLLQRPQLGAANLAGNCFWQLREFNAANALVGSQPLADEHENLLCHRF